MGATTQFMTFAEFEKLAEPMAGHYELRHGELIQVPPPKQVHTWLQQRIMRCLDRRAEAYGAVGMEIPFQPVSGNEYYRVDVAFVLSNRWNSDRTGYPQGSPELIVEVLSPSNTISEMNDRRSLFLESGCREFWLVDGDHFQIDVSTPDGITTTYRRGQIIPLPLFASASLPVDEIFQGLS